MVWSEVPLWAMERRGPPKIVREGGVKTTAVLGGKENQDSQVPDHPLGGEDVLEGNILLS